MRKREAVAGIIYVVLGLALSTLGACGESSEPRACEPEQVQLPDGSCAPVPSCEPGYTGPDCRACAPGYHDDGNGVCTTDACRPNPCLENEVCTLVGDAPACECAPGYHRGGSLCVPDESCEGIDCSGHGTCEVVGGEATCACEPGYQGDQCESCADGFHDDGQGGCTTDICLPNPCNQPNKTQCQALSSIDYQCSCDPGYHADGQGGCTQDVCLPNPCAVTNQACVPGGPSGYTCVTPVCDDGNPCTNDVAVGGACQFTARANGTSCIDNLCFVGQACQAGQCVGGTAAPCGDGNPCTADSCDPATGCKSTVNNALVPDDGFACTADSCSGGLPQYVPTDALCNDGKYCTGVETCVPSSGAANAAGCVTQSVPVAPADGQCVTYEICNEASDSFPPTYLGNGATCDDGNICTHGDTCDGQGGCAGTLDPTCTVDATCTNPQPFSGVLNVATAQPTITVNYNGGVPTYALGGDTGPQVLAHDKVSDSYYDLGVLRRTSWQAPWVNTFTAHTYAGVYDIYVLENAYRFETLDKTLGYSLVPPADGFPGGLRRIAQDVSFGAGASTHVFNVATAQPTITVNYNGGVPTYALGGDTGPQVLAHDKVSDSYYDLGVLRRTSWQAPWVNTFTAHTYAGVYDIYVLENAYRFETLDKTLGYSLVPPADGFPGGLRRIAQDVSFGAGASTHVFNVATAQPTITVNYNGGVPTYALGGDTGPQVLAHDKVSDSYYDLGVLRRTSWQAPWVNTFTAHTYAGVYDIYVLENAYRFETLDKTLGYSLVPPADGFPGGLRRIAQDVSFGAGASTHVFNVATAQPTITVNYNGGVPTYALGGDTGPQVLAHDKVSDSYYDLGVLRRTSWQAPWVNTFTAHTYAGVYDIYVLESAYRFETLDKTLGYSLVPPADGFPGGMRRIAQDVSFGAGASTHVFNVATAQPTITVNYNGGVPTYALGGDTGPQVLAHDKVSDSYYDLGVLRRTSWQAPWVNTFTAHTYAGVYDIYVLENAYRFETLDKTLGYSLVPPADGFPGGLRRIAQDVSFGAGASTHVFNVATAQPTITVNYNGGVPTYALGGDTGPQVLAHDKVSDSYYDLGVLRRTSWQAPWVNTFTAHTYAGVYDIYVLESAYRFETLDKTLGYSLVPPADGFPGGMRLVQTCVALP